jgi:hypothetical protein
MRLVLPQVPTRLVPDIGHTYLIPMFILILISVSNPVYQTNTGCYCVDFFLKWIHCYPKKGENIHMYENQYFFFDFLIMFQ